MDKLATEFKLGDKVAIVEKARKIAKSKFEKYYVKAMEKIIFKKDYADKEAKRLSGILESGSASDDKLDDMVTRRNILWVFQGKSKIDHEEL